MEQNPSPRLWQGGPWEQPQSAPAVLPVLPDSQGQPDRRTGPRRKKRRGLAVFSIFLVLILGLTASAAALAHFGLPQGLRDLLPQLPDLDPDFGYDGSLYSPSTAAQTTIPRAPAGGDAELVLSPREGEALSLQEIYEKNISSIVYIRAYQSGGVGSGTGIILSEDGYILTNEHVISGASSAQVVLQDNTVLEAKLVGSHEGNDLAVLKVEATGLPPAEFGDSAQLSVGDSVVAIGNPLGSSLRGTMTEGIVSAINRSVDMDGSSMTLIQTTAALNPGNSGGALINDRGQVVGITTLKMMSQYATIEGLGFAIPSRLAKGVVDQIIATGVARTPALGITVFSDVTKYGGLKVMEVKENSDAWAKGLREGDIIVAADGMPITDNAVLTMVKEPLGVGDTITLTIEREGQRLELEIVLMDSELFQD